ncbi:glycosyltransferase family 2 protein [Roseivirga pacifica]
MKPLVTVIGISFNHAAFIEEALNSLFNQSYENLQVILLDDGSSDGSAAKIEELIGGREIEFIHHKRNKGYTATFNEGFRKAEGDFIIDFALDDVMKPDFIAKSIDRFEQASEQTGVVFSNADFINEQSQVTGNHTQALLEKGMISQVPQGNVFSMILRRYFVCTPTMVIRRRVLERLGGYDESLAYEDFDFWVRSARYYEYAYINEVLMQKRLLKTSMSANRHLHHYNELMTSVFQVCQKAFQLCKTDAEFEALGERLNYEYRQCLKFGAINMAQKYRRLIVESGNSRSLKSFAFRWLVAPKMLGR